MLELLNIEDHDTIDRDLKLSEFIEDKNWNTHKLSQYIRNQDIVHKIIGIPIPISDTKDFFCWGLSSTGGFMTKLATWLALDPPQEAAQWPYKWIWKIDTMPKIKIFLWQRCHNARPIRETLLRRGCHIEPQCPLCQNEIETSDHMFGDCSQTNKVWDLAKLHN